MEEGDDSLGKATIFSALGDYSAYYQIDIGKCDCTKQSAFLSSTALQYVPKVPDIFLPRQLHKLVVKISVYKEQTTSHVLKFFSLHAFLHCQRKSVWKHDKRNVLFSCVYSSTEDAFRDSVSWQEVYDTNATNYHARSCERPPLTIICSYWPKHIMNIAAWKLYHDLQGLQKVLSMKNMCQITSKEI